MQQDEDRRQANVADVDRQLYEMYEAGALTRYVHHEEPGRHDSTIIVDVWELTFDDGTSRTMPYAQVRSFLRGWRIGRRFPRR